MELMSYWKGSVEEGNLFAAKSSFSLLCRVCIYWEGLKHRINIEGNIQGKTFSLSYILVCGNFHVEPPNKGHFGANSFVPCREVVPISEGPLSEVPL